MSLRVLLAPSALLLPVLWVYVQFDSTEHFFVHTLTGWVVGLLILLAAAARGYGWSRWHGLVPVVLAVWAMTPDLIYRLGPAHRDWMDLFLFHVALDEILPLATAVLLVLWAVLLASYLRCRAGRRGLRRGRRVAPVLACSTAVLLGLVGYGVVTERSASTPLVQVGQPAPDFALPSAQGRFESLAGARGAVVMLAFVPSVLCDFCRAQLRALQQALPELERRRAKVLVVSTDATAVQQAVVDRLGLTYPILSEAPIQGHHPVGSAYGVYHLRQPHPGPVDANAIVAIDAAGTVGAVRLEPGRAVSVPEILALAEAAGARP